MERRQDISWAMVVASVAAGLAGQAVFGWVGVGLNAALMAGLVMGLVAYFALKLPQGPHWSMWFWGLPVLAGAIGLLMSDNPTSKVLNLAMVGAGCGMMAFSARTGTGQGALATSLLSLFGWMVVLTEGTVAFFTRNWKRRDLTEAERAKVAAVAKGVAIAAPMLVVFGVLLVSADPVFAKMMTPHVDVDGPDLMLRFANFGGAALFTLGMLAMVSRGPNLLPVAPPKQKVKSIGATEHGIVFGSLIVLFGLFLAVQARYLFGGNDHVLATQGLTYAQYARRGFFELLTVAGMALPLTLVMSGLTSAKSEKSEGAMRVTRAVFLALVGVMLASAAQRMGLYVSAYGLTELRLYVAMAIGWLAVFTLAMVYLVGSGKEGRSGTWLVGSAMACLLVVSVMDPDRTIASYNLASASKEKTVDTQYLLGLGSGVVAPILDSAEMLDTAKAAKLSAELQDRFGSRGDWREWSVSREMAYERLHARDGAVASLR